MRRTHMPFSVVKALQLARRGPVIRGWLGSMRHSFSFVCRQRNGAGACLATDIDSTTAGLGDSR
eukprot:scaffold113996_cov48-Prasinocladus_malaysianus.AAC.1